MPKQVIKILGMDPSFSNWGLAAMAYDLQLKSLLLAKLDVVQPPSDDSKQVRQSSKDMLRAEYLLDYVKAYLPFVDVICVEVPHGSQNARASLGAGVCLGVLAGIKQLVNIPVIYVNAGETRKEITGKNSATKQQAIDWATGLYPGPLWPMYNGKLNAGKAEHMADAIAAVHAGMKTETFKVLEMLANKE